MKETHRIYLEIQQETESEDPEVPPYRATGRTLLVTLEFNGEMPKDGVHKQVAKFLAAAERKLKADILHYAREFMVNTKINVARRK